MKKIKRLTTLFIALMACVTMSVTAGCISMDSLVDGLLDGVMGEVVAGFMPATSSETSESIGLSEEESSIEGESSIEEESSSEESSSDSSSSVEEPTKYVVVFKNADGTVLQRSEVEEGEMPEYTGETPTQDATAQYT